MSKISKLMAVILLIFGFALAAFAFFLSGDKSTINNEVFEASKEEKKIDAVVAVRDLSAGHLLTKEDLEFRPSPAMVMAGFKTVEEALGKTLTQDIQKDQVILQSAVVAGIAGLIVEGERAVSIKVDETSSVGHKVQPGDWVDVFVVLKRDSQEVNATQARMVLPRKRVIAYGDLVYGQPADEDAEKKDTSSAVRTAVLAVKVEEVNRLLIAEQQGQVQLALRNPLDQNEPSADMLKQLPGLSVRKVLNQDVSDATAAINDSLAAIKFEDLAKDVRWIAVKDSPEGSPQMKKRSNSKRLIEHGVTVEVIRGSRKETVRY